VLPRPKLEDPESLGAIWMGFLQVDSVNLVFFGRPDFETMWWPGTLYKADDGPQKAFEPTRGSVVDRIGFSYLDIDPVLERMESTGAEIVRGIETDPDFGFRSFLVAGPDGILVEIVEDAQHPGRDLGLGISPPSSQEVNERTPTLRDCPRIAFKSLRNSGLGHLSGSWHQRCFVF
jgi:hypothetical protein